jgi:RNA pol II accessory factor, Cdc73 family, C-terminal/Paf1 complex subunit CDC73 N-terminal
MSTFHDPISLLKEYISSSKKIDSVGGKLYFSNLEIPLNHLTAWKPKQSGKQYSIGSLWFFLQNHQLNKGDYARASSKAGVEMVSIPDRAEILAYFTGEKDTTDSIDEELRSSTLIEKIAEETKNSAKEALERPLCTKESILQTPNTSYKYLLSYCKDNLKNNKRQRETSTVSLLEEIMSGPDKHPDNQPRPIIIVPSNLTPGGICYNNSVEFLEKGNYIDPTLVTGNLPSGPLLFNKKIRGKVVTFEVYDQTLSFTKAHWRRTVAVFVQGPRYQFKDWPWSNDLITLFLAVRGFYMNYQDSPIDENIKKWYVKILQISRNKRHLDKTIQHEFWTELEKFIFSPRYKSKN